MPIDQQDREFLQAAEAALAAAWDRYHDAKPADQPLLYPQIELAYQRWLEIRLRLLDPDPLSSAADVAEARTLRKQIEQAADQQALVIAVVRLVALLAKFA